jgi:hypothetical protein
MRLFIAPALVAFALAGCATTHALPTDATSAAIRSAEEIGAERVPEAALHLQLAKEEVAAAEELNAAGNADEANSWLLRAEADAELAVALSRADADKAEALAAIERVRKLRAENPYSPGVKK